MKMKRGWPRRLIKTAGHLKKAGPLLGGLFALGLCLFAPSGCAPSVGPLNDTDRDGSSLMPPQSRTGTLTVTADTSALVLSAPSMTGSLTPAGAGSTISLGLTVDEASANYDGMVQAGIYLLQLDLCDGAAKLASYVDTVVVAADSATTCVLSCKPKDGHVVVRLVDQIARAIAITFRGARSTLGPGTTMTVTATPAISVDSYQWYLDGVAIGGATANHVTVGRGLETGSYSLTLVVRKGSVYSSRSVGFTVAAGSGPD